MSHDRQYDALKVILFMALMLLIVEMSPILTHFFTGDMYLLVGTITFFATFFFMYLVIEGFVKWDGTSITKLGIDIDEKTIHHLLVGAIAGILSALVVVAIAYVYEASLRPLTEITADLIVSEIIITTPIALFEELAHRGYILPRIETLLGKTSAILISSLFFSFLHFSWWTFPIVTPLLISIFTFNIFLGGIILSLSYYWSGRRLWVPISFHFAWNMLAYILFPSFPREPVLQPELFQIEWGITTIIGFLFGLSLLYGLLYSKRENKR
ncbi:CPBP family intramembrane metalloprotease [Candidatus Thorarchaeota archaeon]|nr:MAG: CPBP family intramembrane metalloprotease [Candidatus Thorarchaeota archaeon]